MRYFIFLMGLSAFSKELFANSAIQNLVSKVENRSKQSIEVVRVSDGKTIFSHNDQVLLTPASVSKLTIAAAALEMWGPQYTFSTKVYYTGGFSNGVISGDLIVKGDGDPFLVNEKISVLASDLKNRGVKEVKGKFILDPSLFDLETRDESREEGKLSSDNAYDAPISGAGVNFNTFEVAISPDESGARVLFSPFPLKGFSITNKLKLGSSTNVQVERFSSKNGRASLVATGTVAKDAGLIKMYRSVNNPHLASAEMVRAFIENQGIVIRGDIGISETPKAASEILTLTGYSLDFIVKGLNNFSNNYIADMLLKRMGSAFPASGLADQPGSGTESSGLKVLERYLKSQVGIKTPFVLKNASGLSFENRLSAGQINQILLRMAKSLDVFPEFFASLPAAGRDGTLKKRFQNNEGKSLAANIRAKTGTLTSPRSVSSLAGYVKTPNDGLLAFAIIGNGIEGKAQPTINELHGFQDKLVSLLASGDYK